jgi:molybdenum cofactor guanylyltransferase
MTAPVSAIVLAGGRSSRMGRPKAALPFGATTILERMLSELRREFEDLIVVGAAADAEPFPIDPMIRGVAGVVLVRDEQSYAGPAVALVRGLAAARNDIAFACSCDLPLVRVELARTLCGMIDSYDAVIPEVGAQLQPLCAAYRRASREAIAAISGERRLTAIVSRLAIRRVGVDELRRIDPDLRSFLNVNTPDDYARALKLGGI